MAAVATARLRRRPHVRRCTALPIATLRHLCCSPYAKPLRHAPRLKFRFSAALRVASHGLQDGLDDESRYRFVTAERVPAGGGRVAERRCCLPAGAQLIRRQHAQSTLRRWFQQRVIRELPFKSPCNCTRASARKNTSTLEVIPVSPTSRAKPLTTPGDRRVPRGPLSRVGACRSDGKGLRRRPR